MRKVVWRETGQLEFIEDRAERPAPAAGEVAIRITAAGVCGTDVHIIQGRVRFVDPPLVLGHELAGVVEECGPGVGRLAAGDRVKCDSVIGCGHCDWCRAGATQFCPDCRELGITCNGGWADWLVVPERILHRLPDCITDEVAAILDVEVYGALRKPGVCPGDTVVVFGPGPGGLIALQLARVMGAGTVILCGTRRERLDLGKRLGADSVVDVTVDDPVSIIRDLTSGRGADLVIEAAGASTAVLHALEVVRPQGRIVFYGVHGRPLPEFPLDRLVLKDVVAFGSLSNRTGWEGLIDLAATGRLDLASLITHRFPLEDAAEAFKIVSDRSSGAIKAVLVLKEPARRHPRCGRTPRS